MARQTRDEGFEVRQFGQLRVFAGSHGGAFREEEAGGGVEVFADELLAEAVVRGGFGARGGWIASVFCEDQRAEEGSRGIFAQTPLSEGGPEIVGDAERFLGTAALRIFV